MGNLPEKHVIKEFRLGAPWRLGEDCPKFVTVITYKNKAWSCYDKAPRNRLFWDALDVAFNGRWGPRVSLLYARLLNTGAMLAGTTNWEDL